MIIFEGSLKRAFFFAINSKICKFRLFYIVIEVDAQR
jgi:hypothetical protein